MESDSRISTNARLLSHAVTEDDFAKACNQIESLLGSLENRKYITKSFSFLQDPFLDGFKWIQRKKLCLAIISEYITPPMLRF